MKKGSINKIPIKHPIYYNKNIIITFSNRSGDSRETEQFKIDYHLIEYSFIVLETETALQ